MYSMYDVHTLLEKIKTVWLELFYEICGHDSYESIVIHLNLLIIYYMIYAHTQYDTLYLHSI